MSPNLRQKEHKKIIKRFVSLALLVVLFATPMFGLTAHADEPSVDPSHSIVGDWFNKVFGILLTDGHLTFETGEDREFRIAVNNDIFDNDNSTATKYSLYDRFGGDIKFVPYFGEVRIETGIFDRFYNKIVKNDGEFKLTLDDIKLFLQESSISNNVIYTNRPNIISQTEVEAGYRDPRVNAYKGVNPIGGEAALANLELGVSKFFVSLVAFMSGSGLFNTIDEIVRNAYDAGFVDVVDGLAKFILPLAIFVALVHLTSMTMKIIKGSDSIKHLLTYLLSVVISLGFVFLFCEQPAILNDMINTSVTFVDDMFDKGLSQTGDEVVQSDVTVNVRDAILWKTAVFQPWCYGQFGDKYENLYTTFADLSEYYDDRSAMEQSNDDVLEAWDGGQQRYNSVLYTGDPVIPIGNDEVIRNWAALSWSCQSIYHIDATELEYERYIPATWPKAEVTPSNNQIYVDNFRWLDAQLDISPEYRNVDDVRVNYTGSDEYEQWFVKGGAKSILMTLFMIPIMLLGFRKVVVSIKLIMNGVSLLCSSLMCFIIPDRYDPVAGIKRLLETFFDYVWWSVVIFITILLYSNMVGDAMIPNVIFLGVGIYLNMVKPIRTTAQFNRVLNRVKSVGNGVKRTAKKAGSAIMKHIRKA